MINPSSEELVCPFRLQTPDVSIYLGDLVDSSAVYDSFTSASKVWKNVGKLVAIESMSEELDGKLCILTFVRPPDELEVAFEETRLSQTEIVGGPGSSVAVRPTIDTEAGKHPRRKVPTVPKARRKSRPHSLIRWTSSTHANKMFARKVEYSVISLHSLSRKCSGSTQTTCHLIHSLISSAK